jgi:hypothetical protein
LINIDKATNELNGILDFIVRTSDPGSKSKIIFVWPVLTYQTYNTHGGKSVYEIDNPSRSRVVLSGKLFAINSDARLLCREPVEVDIVWTEIGDTPENVIALAGYYGRLFAVTSDGDLWWRAVGCIPSPLFTGSLLFYNSKEGKVSIGPFDGNGDFRTEQYYPDPANGHESFEKNWTHILPANNGLLLFYDAASGRASTGELEDDGTYKNLQDYPDPANGHESFEKNWTHIVPGKNSLFFFYNSANGKGLAGGVTISGIYKNLQTYLENTFALGWTNIVSCTKR